MTNKASVQARKITEELMEEDPHIIDLEAPVIGNPPILVWIDPSLIYVDSSYQRQLNISFVRELLTSWNWKLVGAVSLSLGAGGRWAVTDGQHRVIAAQLHPKINLIPAIVEYSENEVTTTKDQAEVFVGINTKRNKVNYIDLFYADREAENPDVLAIDRAMHKCNLKLPNSVAKKLPKEVHCLSSLRLFVRPSSANALPANSQRIEAELALENILKAVVAGAGTSPEALSSSFLGALLYACTSYKKQAANPDFVSYMAKAILKVRDGKTVNTLSFELRNKHKVLSVRKILAQLLVTQYNELVGKDNRTSLFFATKKGPRARKA